MIERDGEWLPYDCICVVGDSITHTGLYARTVVEFAASRYPERRRSFVNCGVAGETALAVQSRMDRDVLIHRPDAAFVMFGMNDIGRNLYPEEARNGASGELLDARERKLAEYGANMERVVGLLQSKSIGVTLMTPTPYEQLADLPGVNWPGCNEALGRCADAASRLAAAAGAGLIDLWSPMNAINDALRAENGSASLIGADRVHPGARGHMVMAYLFLKQSGARNRLPSVLLDGARLEAVEVRDCAIGSIGSDGDGTIRLSYTSDRIPLFLDDAYRSADGIVPFTDEFNREQIRVSGLAEGDYECEIDGQYAGLYKAAELADKGINAAVIEGATGQRHAAELHRLSAERYELESRIRSVRFIEQVMLASGVDFGDPEVARRYVRQCMAELAPDEVWIGEQYSRYLAFKPAEDELFVGIREASERMREFARPFARTLTLRPRGRG